MPRRVGSASVLRRRASGLGPSPALGARRIGAHAHHDETGQVEEQALVREVRRDDDELSVGAEPGNEVRQHVTDVAVGAGDLVPLRSPGELVAFVGADLLDGASPYLLPRRADRRPHRLEQFDVVLAKPRGASQPGQPVEHDVPVAFALRGQGQIRRHVEPDTLQLREQCGRISGEELVRRRGRGRGARGTRGLGSIVGPECRLPARAARGVRRKGRAGRGARRGSRPWVAACRTQHSSTGADARTVTLGPNWAPGALSSDGIVI